MELADNSNSSTSNEILARLKRLFGDTNVVPEWDVAKNSLDAYTRELYCHRVDFAVGPFNIDANTVYNNNQIDETYRRYAGFLELLKSQSDSRDRILKPNENPRCFLVIEAENRNTAKHRLGSIVNASALGKIGIIVGSNERIFESPVKIRKYLEFLEKVDKTRSSFENLIIITQDNFLRSLTKVSSSGISN